MLCRSDPTSCAAKIIRNGSDIIITSFGPEGAVFVDGVNVVEEIAEMGSVVSTLVTSVAALQAENAQQAVINSQIMLSLAALQTEADQNENDHAQQAVVNNQIMSNLTALQAENVQQATDVAEENEAVTREFPTHQDLLNARLEVGDHCETRGYWQAGDGGHGQYIVEANDGSTVDGCSDGALHSTLQSGLRLRQYLMTEAELNVKQFGANVSADAGRHIQTAIDCAANISSGARSFISVTLAGSVFPSTTAVEVKNGVVLRDGGIDYCGDTAPDNGYGIVFIGTANGTTIVRTAGVENVRVKVRTPSIEGLVGFQINFARSSWIKNCVAEMAGDTRNTLGHVGFEILGSRLAVVAQAEGTGRAGTYQNTIDTCLALFANTGFRLRTRGDASQAAGDPQANGNFIKNCGAYSCRQYAIHIADGAQENHCEIRADTWPRNGSGVVVVGPTAAARIDGNFNHLVMMEEIGVTGVEQHSVVLGPAAAYNYVEFSTQQIAPGYAAIDDTNISLGARATNIIKQVGPGLVNNVAGSAHTVAWHGSVAGGQRQAIQQVWIAPAKCVIVSCRSRLAPNTRSSAFIYFAKNSAFTTINRVEHQDNHNGRVEVVRSDARAAEEIASFWVLEQNDILTIAVDTHGGSITGSVTCLIKYV